MKIQDWKEAAQQAARELNRVDEATKIRILEDIAQVTEAQIPFLLEENGKDLQAMDKNDPLYDRLLLTDERLRGIAADMRKVARLDSPLHRVLEQRTLPNGLKLRKVSVPFGVIGIIYEARPNVSFDVFSLCFKSGNVCVLKGGTNAHHSNAAIVGLIQQVLQKN